MVDLTPDDGPFGGILQRNDQKIQLRLTTMTLNDWLNSGSNIHLLAPKINGNK